MKLPNGDHAVVPIEKLRDYCLNPQHTEGRHKALVFAAVLGLTAAHAEDLRRTLLAVARTHEAVFTKHSPHGQHFVLDFRMTAPGGREGVVRSAWIVLNDENFPRLVSCYVLKKGDKA